MAGQHADMLKLSPDDLKIPGDDEIPGAPIVHVENIEEVTPEGEHAEEKKETHHSRPKPGVTHETKNVKTTVTQEDDDDASFVDKVKGKVVQIGDKLRPESAVHAKNADPHPSVM